MITVIACSARPQPNGLDEIAQAVMGVADAQFVYLEEVGGAVRSNVGALPAALPKFYAEEIAYNWVADRAIVSGVERDDILIFVPDLTRITADLIERAADYLHKSGAPLVSGVCHRIGTDSYLPDREQLLKCPQAFLHGDPPAGPVAAEAHLIHFVFTAVWAKVWQGVNGFDERFAGANGYIDTNVARRIERVFGKCHVHTGLVVEREDYRGTSNYVRKPKLFDDGRNALLDARIAKEEIDTRGLIKAERLRFPYSRPFFFPEMRTR